MNVLATRQLPKREGAMDAEIILCAIPENTVTPFATWQRNIADKSRYWGHYFKTQDEAYADFIKR